LHRVFAALVGETLFDFIQRVRVERAAVLLIYNPRLPLTEIGDRCGYSSPSSFSRAFRAAFGMTPTAWRRQGRTNSNQGQVNGNPWKADDAAAPYAGDASIHHPRSNTMNATIDVTEFPDMTVAYLRHVGPYQGDEQLFERLWGTMMRWAGPRKLMELPTTQALIIYHDNPEITPDDRLRLSVCLTVPEETEVDGEIGKMTVPGGDYAVAHFEVGPDDYGPAWQWVYGTWLPKSGYQPDDRPSFEMHPGNGEETGSGKRRVDICVPVRPL
jgi:AraC family transcriptional regulator